jgi:hypothetical protein
MKYYENRAGSADLDDIRVLAESGLNWKTIIDECQNQSTSSGCIWENALYQKLLDLKEKYHNHP